MRFLAVILFISAHFLLAQNQDVEAHLRSGNAWMIQYVPGAQTPENREKADKAHEEFRIVLQLEPNNKVALAALGNLTLLTAQEFSGERKSARLDEAASWYYKLRSVDTEDKTAYYSLALITWTKWYPAYMQARADLGMKPEDPGPMPDTASVRQQLRQTYSKQLEQGIANLKSALAIDPSYDDAMAYMNLFIRERADLDDSREQYQRDIAIADDWVQKALDAKRAKALAAAPAPAANTPPQRVRVGGNVAASNLMHRVEPEYPLLARQARIQGTVRFMAVISKDGRVQNVTLSSGHPLLVGPARNAAMQWQYKPTLLNGQPVEVVTTIDVNFVLPPN